MEWHCVAIIYVLADVRELGCLETRENPSGNLPGLHTPGDLFERGHRVLVVGNGREALHSIETHRFDLVLMDVQMPEMDGLEATTELRKMELGKQLHQPVVALTAHAMKGDREKCAEAGMDGYLTKPVKSGEFDAVLQIYATQNRHPVA